MTKPEDASRSRSLRHLILASARTSVLTSSDVHAARELVSNIQIEDEGDFWCVRSILDGKRIEIQVSKKQFVFYPTKEASAYSQNPYIQNRKEATSVVNQLFAEAGLINYPENRKTNYRPNTYILFSILFLQVTVLLSNVYDPGGNFAKFLVIGYVVISSLTFYSDRNRIIKVALTGVIFTTLFELGYSTSYHYWVILGFVLLTDEIACMLGLWRTDNMFIKNISTLTLQIVVLSLIASRLIEEDSLSHKVLFLSLLVFKLSFIRKMPLITQKILLSLSILTLFYFLLETFILSPHLLFRIPIVLSVSLWITVNGFHSTPLRVFSGLLTLGV